MGKLKKKNRDNFKNKNNYDKLNFLIKKIIARI